MISISLIISIHPVILQQKFVKHLFFNKCKCYTKINLIYSIVVSTPFPLTPKHSKHFSLFVWLFLWSCPYKCIIFLQFFHGPLNNWELLKVNIKPGIKNNHRIYIYQIINRIGQNTSYRSKPQNSPFCIINLRNQTTICHCDNIADTIQSSCLF